MRIAINASNLLQSADLGQLRDHAAEAAEAGFSGWWLAQTGLIDALTVFTAIGDTAPGIELGTAVVPTFPRHPTMLAGQALTTQAALGDRPLALGIGLSFEKPIRHLMDYLSILQPLLEEGSADHAGEVFTAHVTTARPPVTTPSVLVAALGPQALRVTGRRTDGTVLWMVGPRTIADHIGPVIRSAAAEVERPEPRIVCSLPVCVTDDEDEVRNILATVLEIYGLLPSYRAMLDREGVDGPGGVAVVGDEASVTAQLDALAAAGATDFSAVEFGRSSDEYTRTRALLADRC